MVFKPLAIARRLLSSAYVRITLSGVTLSFFLLSVSFCLVQIGFHGFLWDSDTTAFDNFNGILQKTDVPSDLLRWLEISGDDYLYRVCTETPFGVKNVSEVCPIVYDSRVPAQPDWAAPPNIRKDSLQTEITPLALTVALAMGNGTVQLSEQCTYTLLYPTQRLGNSLNEELALIFSQVWLLGISSAAIIWQSVPHLVAVFAMRVLATAWCAYTVWRTHDLDTRLWHILIGPDTPCHTDFDFLQGYISSRLTFQIPDLVLSIVALLFTAILGWRLLKSFSENVFNCVGPPARIVRLYRYMLTVLVSGQLLLYLMIASVSLALKEAIRSHANLLWLVIVFFVIALLLALVMIPLGYYCTRQERKGSMVLFIVFLLSAIFAFFALFGIPAFQWTWLQWPFFAGVTSINAAVLVCCTACAILLRIHVGEGLSHYLHVEQVLSAQEFASDDFSTGDLKVREHDRLSFVLHNSKQTAEWDVVSQTHAPVFTVKLDASGRVNNDETSP
ncbi:hypothetical protein BC835DRAFT_100563 [Cytidiella melzeri]|nr:hypothetical protein BC835DRAFT_100563 [Cytidiella melzeri]